MKENTRRDMQMKAKAQAEVKARVAEKFGFNLETGKDIKPKKARYTVYKQERKEAVKQGIDMIDADINELVNVEEKEYQPKKRRSFRKIIKRNFKEIVIGIALMYTTVSGSYYLAKGLKYLGDERRLNNITETVSENLEKVVEDATVKSNDTVFYVKYDEIANYIQNSSNPDLELFTLYRDYDRDNGNGTKEYRYLAEKVAKKLTYEDRSGNDHTYMTFLQYVSGDYIGNQEEGALLDRYYDDCKTELLHGDDLVLNQLPYKVKKLTYTNSETKETY